MDEMTRGPHSFYLEGLNSEQKRAVECIDGPVLVLAGAGTGKTRVLTARIAHMVSSGLAYPSEILSVTFTNKAASEMRERVQKILSRPIEGVWLGTFHSLCVRILRRHAELVDLETNFTILDSDDQQRLLKQLIKAENLDDRKYPPRLVQAVIGRWKDRALLPSRTLYGENPVIAKLYEQYQERLRVLNAADFGDLILHCLTLFKKDPSVLKQYQDKFRYLLVDEYQDTNVAQYLWLRLLAQGSGNICCVGDDDQSIYGWRGAEVGNILKFEKDFPGTVVVRLEQNYRSTSHILGAASGLIAHNEDRLGKTLWTDGDEGENVLVRGTWDSEVEARFVAEEIETYQRQGEQLGECAILVRAGFQTREFEERLLKLGIPYRVVGGARFYERSEIKDAIAYIRLLVQPNDGLAFERIVNTPKRGIGQTTIQNLHMVAREQDISLPQAALLFSHSSSKSMACNALRTFFYNLERWRRDLETEPHVEVVKKMLDESGYTQMWQDDPSPDSPGRLENLKELVNAIEEFQYLPGFLDHVSLVMDNNQKDQKDMVNVMTLHAAKGLEFDHVFLAGWEEGIFPHARSLGDSGLKGLEEERRLGYVGISRAKKKAIITYALKRRNYQGWQPSRPSRFLKELPKDHCLYISPNGTEMETFDAPTPLAISHGSLGANPFTQKKISFKKGQRVFHEKFGYGSVVRVDGERVDVNFEHGGTKKIIASFLNVADSL
jgi:DNA helicase-2/ATP-dependent DNA helicase PcrA